jgi:hypothetical protein
MRLYPGNSGHFSLHDTLISVSYLNVWGTALQVGRSRVRLPLVSVEFFIDINLPAALSPWGWLSLLTEISTRNISWGLRRPVGRADNLTTFMCRLSWNLGDASTWNPQSLFRPVTGIASTFSLKVCYSLHKIINLLAFHIQAWHPNAMVRKTKRRT